MLTSAFVRWITSLRSLLALTTGRRRFRRDPNAAILSSATAIGATEGLESRLLLSADAGGGALVEVLASESNASSTEAATEICLDDDGNLVINDATPGGADDALRIRSFAARSEFTIQDRTNRLFTRIPGASESANGEILIPFSSVTGTQMIVNTLGGDDSLAIDETLGRFSLAITFNGGEQSTAAGDELILVNAANTAGTVTYGFSGRDSQGAGTGFDGTVNEDGRSVAFTGVDSMIDVLAANRRIFQFGDTADQVTLEDSGLAEDEMSRLVSNGTSPSVQFRTPRLSLDIRGGAGDDVINVTGIDDLFEGELQIDGQADSDDVEIDLFEPPGGQLITGASPDILFVMDTSYSTVQQFSGSAVGDQNNDGVSNTILDAQIAAFSALNQDLIDRGVGDVADVGVLFFSGRPAYDNQGALLNDMDLQPANGVTQISTSPAAQTFSGARDVDRILGNARPAESTNYEAAFQKAIEYFTQLGTAPGEGSLIFLSDGEPTQASGGGLPENSFQDEIGFLRNSLGINLRAFGVGNDANLSALQDIDPTAIKFTQTNELLEAVGGLQQRTVSVSDSGTAVGEADSLSLNGTDAADTFIAQGSRLTMSIPNQWEVTYDGIESAVINSRSGDDRLILDPVIGLNNPLTFNGGAGIDALELSRRTFDTVTHSFDASAGGTVELTRSGDTSIVSHSELESISDSLIATDRMFQFGDSADEVTLLDDAVSDNERSQIFSAGTSTSVDFATPEDSLTILAGAGDDAVNVIGVDDKYEGQINVDGQAGADDVNVDLFDVPGAQLVTGSQPDVLFVIDVSGSSSNPFAGSSVGDLNGDGIANSIIDAEIRAFIDLNQDLIDRGVGESANVGVVAFSGPDDRNTPTLPEHAVFLDLDPVAPGTQNVTSPDADVDGVALDVNQALQVVVPQVFPIRFTNYEAPLRRAVEYFTQLGTVAGSGSVVFLSDGAPNRPAVDENGNPTSTIAAFADELATLQTMGINLRAFGVGAAAQLVPLQAIDPLAQIFTTTDTLLEALGGVDQRLVNVTDSGTDATEEDRLTVNGGDGDEVLRVTPGQVEMTIPDRWLVQHDGIEGLTVSTNGGDDVLLVNTAGIPASGLTYNGGGPGDNDTLEVTDGTFDDAVHSFDNAADGSIVYSTGAETTSIVFTELESITDNTTVATRTFNFSAADDRILLGDDGASNGFSHIDSDFAELTAFRSPSDALVVNPGDGDDIVSVQGLDGVFAADLQIGNRNDAEDVRFESNTTSTNGGRVDVAAGNVVLRTRIASGGGRVTLNADTDVSGGGDITTKGAPVDVTAATGNVVLRFIDTSGGLDGGPVNISVSDTGQMALQTVNSGGAVGGGRMTLTGGGRVINRLEGNGGLVKKGSGDLQLQGEQAYSGTTIVAGGTLSLAASQGNNIEESPRILLGPDTTLDVTSLAGATLVLPSGQTLSGRGTIIGSVRADKGSIIDPGTNSAGVLTIRADLELNQSSVFYNIGGPSVGTGPGFHDRINTVGTVTITAGTPLKVNAIDDGSGSDYVPSGGEEFLLIDNAGSDPVVLGTGERGFNGLAEGDVFSPSFLGSGLPATISYRGGNGNDVVLLINTPPTADAGGPYTVAEGGSVVLNASASSDTEQSAASLAYEWDLDGDGTFGETGAAAERGDETGIAPTFDASGLSGPTNITVALLVTDNSGETDSATVAIAVTNVAPQNVNAGANQTVSEGDAVSLSGSFTDPGVNDTHTQTWNVVASNGDVIPGGIGSAFGFTPSGSGIYTVTYSVTDNDGDSATDDVVIIVSNTAPVLETFISDADSLSHKSDDKTVSVSGTFSDSGLSGGHTVLIDWGDGTAPTEATVDQANDSFETTHDYDTGGIFTITATVVDSGGLISNSEITAGIVTGVGLVDGTLYVIGTDGKDKVGVKVDRWNNQLYVDAKLDVQHHHHHGWHGHHHGHGNPFDRIRLTFTASDVEKVVAFLCEGNDTYDGSVYWGRTRNGNSINVQQTVFGGQGNDLLIGGRWNDALFGGEGHDKLFGWNGHDVLVGGDGRDWMWGGRGDDLLIGGKVDNDFTSPEIVGDIDAAMTEWASGNLADAMLHLGDHEDDEHRDYLFGGFGRDSLIGGRRDWKFPW